MPIKIKDYLYFRRDRRIKKFIKESGLNVFNIINNQYYFNDFYSAAYFYFIVTKDDVNYPEITCMLNTDNTIKFCIRIFKGNDIHKKTIDYNLDQMLSRLDIRMRSIGYPNIKLTKSGMYPIGHKLYYNPSNRKFILNNEELKSYMLDIFSKQFYKFISEIGFCNSTENRFEMVMHQKCIRDSDLELGI